VQPVIAAARVAARAGIAFVAGAGDAAERKPRIRNRIPLDAQRGCG
jgi:hypothetical protein